MDGEISDVEFFDLFDTEVVGQVHIPVVKQALSNAKVGTLVAVDHGDLAEIECVEYIQRHAHGQQCAGDVGGSGGLGSEDRGQMYVSEKDEGQGPQRMRRPEDGQEGKDTYERIEEGEQTQRKQGGRKKHCALEALLEVSCIRGTTMANPPQSQTREANERRTRRRPLRPVGTGSHSQAQFVHRRRDHGRKAAQRQPCAEKSGR